MRLTRPTQSYNQRRYGKPWIAKIVINNGKLDYQWGQWIGDAYNGSEGLLVLDNIDVGDIYARGQRDHRKISNSAPDFFCLADNGEGEPITKADAYKLLISKEAANV